MALINYKASNIQGDCTIDEGFKPLMDMLNDTAKSHKIIVIVNSSKRKSTIVPGAIVTPAQMSNHLVGHAIDCNLQDTTTGEFFNSFKMGDGKGLDESFIKDVETKGLRWGGKFKAKDTVHFDDALNLRDPKYWHELNKLYNK